MSRPDASSVATMLTGIQGFESKVTYYAWPEGEAPALPYICYLFPNGGGFGADNINYAPTTAVQVELYSKLKDTASEALIEAKLTDKGIYYSKDSTYLDDQQAWMTVYSFEVI